MIRLLLDQGLPRSTGSLLAESGWDVLHVGDIGMERASDSDILAYALRENRVCVTLDADFHAQLAVSGAAGPATIRIRLEGQKASALAELLKRIWPTIADAAKDGAMITVTAHDVRIRRLPITRGD